jgi:Domain of unknown function (DUF4386)
MNPNRKIARAFGLLLIAGLVFGIFSSVPALEYPDYLFKLASIRTQVLMALFCQFAMATVYACIAVLLFPIIKQYSEVMALGYFGFRIIGAMFLFVGIVSLLLLLSLSENFVADGQPDASHFQTTGQLLRQGRDWMNHVAMILPWSMGGLLLYFIVPFWLSVWGLMGSVLTLIATLLLLFDLVKIITPIYFIMNAPTALFELVLAVFLFAKGFNPILSDANPKK